MNLHRKRGGGGVAKKMPSNIDKIRLWDDNPVNWRGTDMPFKAVRIEFKFPCNWTVLHIDNLKEILRLWIIGEEERYPPGKGYKGRLLLFDEIKKVFEKTEVKK